MNFPSSLCPILTEYLTTQHKLVAMDLEIKRKRKRKNRTLYDLSTIKCSGLTTVKTQEMGEKLMAMGGLV